MDYFYVKKRNREVTKYDASRAGLRAVLRGW